MLRKNEGIDYPDHFLLELVKKRLDLYDIFNIPNLQALANVMVILYICFAEIKTLYISNKNVIEYAKNWR